MKWLVLPQSGAGNRSRESIPDPRSELKQRPPGEIVFAAHQPSKSYQSPRGICFKRCESTLDVHNRDTVRNQRKPQRSAPIAPEVTAHQYNDLAGWQAKFLHKAVDKARHAR